MKTKKKKTNKQTNGNDEIKIKHTKTNKKQQKTKKKIIK